MAFNARVAMRLARGWSQQAVAELWNERFPGANGERPLTAKKLSYWETWPQSGHEPSLTTLGRLAQLYGCTTKDLVDSEDPPSACGAQAVTSGANSSLPPKSIAASTALNSGRESPLALSAAATRDLARQVETISFDELAQIVLTWIRQGYLDMNRRDLLQKVSAALTVAAASPVFDMAEADSRERIAAAVQNPSRIDDAMVTDAEQALLPYRKQGDVLGAHVALQSALAQRKFIAGFLAEAPGTLKPRLLSVYAELSQTIGWQLFDLGDYRAAQYYYDDARTAAHDAENVELVSYVLCTMSQMATWQGKPRVGIDHAVAARSWAEGTGSWAVRAYAVDVAARAYAADGDDAKTRRALDDERNAYAEMRAADQPLSSWWYFYDESFYWSIRAECGLRLGTPEDALYAIETAMPLVDKTNLAEYAHVLVDQSSAHIQLGDIDRASEIASSVARITTVNRSPRIIGRVRDLRAALSSWQQTRAVRNLDDALHGYGIRTSSGK